VALNGLKFILKSSIMIPPELLSLVLIALTIHSLFASIQILGLIFFYLCKECHWHFEGIALNIQIVFGSIVIFTILIPPIH
jgi:hypothetical protein